MLSGWTSFYCLRKEKKVVKGRAHFNIQDGVARSPYRNPFGSIEFSDNMEPRELYEFIKYIEKRLAELGAKRVEIKNYPQLYAPGRVSILCTLLMNLGFTVKEAEISACIQVNHRALFDVMSSWEKRKSAQIKRTNLRFSVLPLQRLNEVYSFISSCRQDRNQALSLSFPQLKNVCDHFPEDFILFGVYDGAVLAAASVCIKVNKTIIYNFYYAHARQYDSLSPVVRLIEGIYQHCQAEKIHLVDLGTSSLNGKPNFSLLDFKLHLGATPTQKLTFEKVL